LKPISNPTLVPFNQYSEDEIRRDAAKLLYSPAPKNRTPASLVPFNQYSEDEIRRDAANFLYGSKRGSETNAVVQRDNSDSITVTANRANAADLYQRVFDRLMSEDSAVESNPLDGYMVVAYRTELSLVAAVPGSATDYETLRRTKKTTFASSGSVSTEIPDMFSIESMTMRTVSSITAANPELSTAIECKMEVNEPHGLNFDYRIREIAGGLGFSNENPCVYVWRLDISFSGFTPEGQWIDRIPFGGFREGISCDRITHFLHLMGLEASVAPTGTKYSLSFVPVSYAAVRDDVILSSGFEITIDRGKSEVNLETFFSLLKSKLEEFSAFRGLNYKFVFEIPDEIRACTIGTTDGEFDGYRVDENKIVISLSGNGSILSMIMTALKSVEILQKLGSEYAEENGMRPAGSPNLSFAIHPDVDYSTAVFNPKMNTYTGTMHIYRIEPFFEWKTTLPASDMSARMPWASKGVRRVYDYAWTPGNTEVLSFDVKLKMFYVADSGTAGLGGSIPLGDSRTPGMSNGSQEERTRSWYQKTLDLVKSYSGGSATPSGNPLDGKQTRISDNFGQQRPGHKHAGIDIRAAIGTPIYATADGVVSSSENSGRYSTSYGNVIYLDHAGGYQTRYAHMSSFASGITRGSRVTKGQLIGYVGNTGRSKGPHLHYEVRNNGRPVDPMDSLNGELPIASNAPAFNPQGGSGDDVLAGGTNSDPRELADGRPIRHQPVAGVDNIIGGGQLDTSREYREKYELQFERKIGPDLVKLEGMEVRGDPRWLVGYYQQGAEEFKHVSSLIRVNMKAPSQDEYMSASSLPREHDLSLGGYYEVLSIEHKLEGGRFTQILGGYRVMGLNNQPFSDQRRKAGADPGDSLTIDNSGQVSSAPVVSGASSIALAGSRAITSTLTAAEKDRLVGRL
jgi:hypothetical protein